MPVSYTSAPCLLHNDQSWQQNCMLVQDHPLLHSSPESDIQHNNFDGQLSFQHPQAIPQILKIFHVIMMEKGYIHLKDFSSVNKERVNKLQVKK